MSASRSGSRASKSQSQPASPSEAPKIAVLARNRKARHEYEILDTFECGIALHGTEVKSIRDGTFSFGDAYGRVIKDELWLLHFHIAPYSHAAIFNHEAMRTRKLLAHRHEIVRIRRRITEKGLTLIPLEVHASHGLIKVVMGLGRGKHRHDKRETIKQRDISRQMDRQIERQMKGR